MGLTIVRKAKPELPAEQPEAPVVEAAAPDLPWVEPKAVEPAPVQASTHKPETEPLPNATGSLSEAQWAEFAASVEQTKDNNIQAALAYLSAQLEKPTLMLIRRATGESFQVLLHDPDTGETKLLDTAADREFKIRLREQENRFYMPLWR